MKLPTSQERRTRLADAVAAEQPHVLSELRAEILALLPPGAELLETPEADSPLARGVDGAGRSASAAGMKVHTALRGDALRGLIDYLRRAWLRHALEASPGWRVWPPNIFAVVLADGPDGRLYLLNIEERGGRSKSFSDLRMVQGDPHYAEVGWTVPTGLIGYRGSLLAALLALPDGADLPALPLITADFGTLDPDGHVDVPSASQLGFAPRAGMIVSLSDGEKRVVARLREGNHYWRLVAEPLSSAREIRA